jgi:esterase/lipase superfamily enzyme
MHREYHAWWSPRLQRDMELLVLGHAGARVLVFPTRAGRFFDYDNWGIAGALASSITQGFIQLYCLDSVDGESLYAFDRPPHERIARHAQYESYVLEEVLPLTCQLNPNPFLIAHGCSLGAYHAVNIAFRHPHLFRKVVALSGRYDLTVPMGRFRDLFDGYYDETIYFHTPCHFIPQLGDSAILDSLRHLEITLAVGEEDVFLESNQRLSAALWEKGIWHGLHLWPGEAHRAVYWREMVQVYL